MKREARRQVLQGNLDRPFKALRPRGGECQFAATAGAHLRILTTHLDAERGLRRTDRERVAIVVRLRCRPRSTDVREPHDEVAVCRRRKEDLRVGTESLRRLVVVLVEHAKHRQAVGGGRRSGRQWLHDPCRLAQGVRDGRRAKKRLSAAAARIDHVARVGALRISPESDDLAARVEIFV